MITKEDVLQILLKHSRNGGDYVPDYSFDKVAEEISNIKTLGDISKKISGITEEKLRKLRSSNSSDSEIKNIIDYIAFIEGWDVGQSTFKLLSENKEADEGTMANQLEEIRKIANNVLYFNDNSDYETALFEILEVLGYSEDDMMELKYIEDINDRRTKKAYTRNRSTNKKGSQAQGTSTY